MFTLPRTVTGAIAGASAAFMCTPADCIKTRFQAEGSSYTSIMNCYQQTVQKEGCGFETLAKPVLDLSLQLSVFNRYGALFKGAVPRMSVTAPLFGIALLAFEMQKRVIRGELKLF